MRDETFDYLHTAIFNIEEALNDDTISSVEESQLRKALGLIEEIVED
jgi:hypothetical protein